MRCRPAAVTHLQWFAGIAGELLTEVCLVANGRCFRLREVEFYLHSSEHPDPFTHGEPAQQTSGQVYFHRRGGSYRGGSFKGLDLTFGPVGDAAGILIRTLEDMTTGEQINGCSCCVDLLLRACEQACVADLDAQHVGRSIWDPQAPIHLRSDHLSPVSITQTARVGLTLKRLSQHPQMPDYVMAAYRFLSDPRIPKGKVYTVLSLIQQGLPDAVITERTGTPVRHVERYRLLREQGSRRSSLLHWAGRDLKTDDICQIHGCIDAQKRSRP